MSLEAFLSLDTATLQRKTQTADASGGLGKSWSTLAADVPVRKEDAKGEAKRRYESRGINVTHRLFTQNGDGRQQDRWLMADGTYHLIFGRMKRTDPDGDETFYVYETQEFLIS